MQQIAPAPLSPDSIARALPPLQIDEPHEEPSDEPEPPSAPIAPETFGVADPFADAAAEAAPVPEAHPPAQAPTDAAPNDLVLRAITQLLVEKGILSRSELIERLGALEKIDTDALGEA